MVVKSPEGVMLIFVGVKERPEEATFMLYKNSVTHEGLQQTAGICYKLSITLLSRWVISAMEPMPFTA